jgi:hypothetical protein
MKKPLESFLADADEATAKVSELARNLGLGAIAIVWIFKNPEGAKVLLPAKILSWALFFAVSSLGLDLLQYIFRSITLHKFFATKEAEYDAGKLTEEQAGDLHTPQYIIIGSNLFWRVKIASVVLSYLLISIFLLSRLS